MEQRLDQILLRRGLVTDEQIRQALLRQKARGGRLGSNLLFFKYITPRQLAEALAEQCGLPCFDPRKHSIDSKVMTKFPLAEAEKHLAVPIALSAGTRVLQLVIADPHDRVIAARAERLMRASSVEALVAPESVVRELIDEHYRGCRSGAPGEEIVELPDIFASEETVTQELELGTPVEARHQAVLMVSQRPFLKNFLGSIFDREGWDLTVLGEHEEVEEALRSKSYPRILVDEAMQRPFTKWMSGGRKKLPQGEISTFSTVSGALLENPVPYHQVIESLLKSLQVLGSYRGLGAGWVPPYALICRDIRRLARELGLRRVAADGLQVAAHLIVPELEGEGSARSGPHRVDPVDFEKSLEIARALGFPWDVAGALRVFLELSSREERADAHGEDDAEVQLAAQVLSLVWYRYAAFHDAEGSSDELLTDIRSALRERAESLATSNVVEAYVRLLEDSGGEIRAEVGQQVFVVASPGELSNQYAIHLTRMGYRTVQIADLAEARRMSQRHPPAVVIVHRDDYPDQALRLASLLGKSGDVLCYAVTSEGKPSLIIDLLDVGYRDVFVPPFDFDVIGARISKALQENSKGTAGERPGSFSASFETFPFTELVQALGQSQKTVHITLSNSSGDQAEVWINMGQMVYARFGDLEGEEAVYGLLRWGEDGWFVAEPVNEAPARNIELPTESILLEGCRLLDESLR